MPNVFYAHTEGMSSPIRVDLPHKLGTAEAKRRIDGGIGRLMPRR